MMAQDAKQLLSLLLTEVANKLKDEPQVDLKQLVAYLKAVLSENSQLASAASRMIQINQNDAKSFQTLVEGGTVLIGDHYHVDKNTLKAVLDTFITEQKRTPISIPQNTPLSSTKKFLGRVRELENLHQKLQRHDEVVIAAVEGMGGVGKTELAIQYSLLHLQSHNYPGGICWLRAREEDIGLQIVQFALTYLDLQPPENLELPERVRWCWQHWHQGNTLLVLDDVKNYSDIKPYLPPQPSQFKVLITSRLKLDLAGSLCLSVLQQEDALLLLAQLIGEEKINQELAQAKELCQRLGYLPLALQLVIRYVKKRKINLAEMLQRLKEKEKELDHPSLVVKENDLTWTLNVKRGVAAAFELSWSDLNDDAQQLGCLLSLFALAPIPWSLVERAASEQDQEELEDARVELENLHLLVGEDSCQLHQLIRKFFSDKQNNLAANKEQKFNFCAAMVAVANEIPQSPYPQTLTREQVELVKDNIPHLEEVAGNQEAAFNKYLIQVFTGLNNFYSGHRLYNKAESWCKKGLLVIKKNHLSQEHLDVATSLNHLANVYFSQKRYTEAEPLYKEALEIRQHLLGKEHVDVAESLHYLANVYYIQGGYKKAEPLYKEVLEMTKSFRGEEHVDVAESLHDLANVYFSQKRYAEAEPLYQRALELYKYLSSEDKFEVAIILNNLARLYRLQKRYAEAEGFCERALEKRKRLLGEDHLDVAESLNNLAELYLSQKRYAEAENFCKQALEMRERLGGKKHVDVASSLNTLAELYRSQKRYAEAEGFCERALEMRKRLLGEDHPDVTESLNNLAGLYFNQRKYTKAERLFQQALELYKHPSSEEKFEVAIILNTLAELYRSQKRYAEAERLCKQALEIRKRLLGEDHLDVVESLNNLARLYRLQGRYIEAEPFCEQALEMRKRLLDEDHLDVAKSLNNLARLYRLQGRYIEAEPLYKQALEMRKRLLGEHHLDVAESFNNLAGLYCLQERYIEAEPLYKQALEMRKRLLGEHHPDVAESLNNLAKLSGLTH